MRKITLIVLTAIVTTLLCVIIFTIVADKEPKFQNLNSMAPGTWPEITMQDLHIQENKLFGTFMPNDDSVELDVSDIIVGFTYSAIITEETKAVISLTAGNYNGTQFANCTQPLTNSVLGIDVANRSNLTFQHGDIVKFCLALRESPIEQEKYRLEITTQPGRSFIYTGILPNTIGGKIKLPVTEAK